MIDTHAHIYLPEFDDDRTEMLNRASETGIKKIFLPNIDRASIDSMIRLANEHPGFCLPMMGLHPCSVDADFEIELKPVEDYLSNSTVQFYGVGECGLDYYWDKSFIDQQKKAFEFQIHLAKKHGLPLIIHSRESMDDCIRMVEENADDNLKGIFHCFSGTEEQLQRIISLGFFAGIGGVATFKNGGLDKVLREDHLEHLVLETDSPYLAPVPFRGKRNEPSYLKFIVKQLSEILRLSEEIITGVTGRNAERVFKLNGVE